VQAADIAVACLLNEECSMNKLDYLISRFMPSKKRRAESAHAEDGHSTFRIE
jgi:hypothetical protein